MVSLRFRRRQNRRIITNRRSHRPGAAKYLDREHFHTDQTGTITFLWSPTVGHKQYGYLMRLDALFQDTLLPRKYTLWDPRAFNDGVIAIVQSQFQTPLNGMVAVSDGSGSAAGSRYHWGLVTSVSFSAYVTRQDNGILDSGVVDATTTSVMLCPMGSAQAAGMILQGSTPNFSFLGGDEQAQAYALNQPWCKTSYLNSYNSGKPRARISCHIPLKRFMSMSFPHSSAYWNNLTASTNPVTGAFPSLWFGFFCPTVTAASQLLFDVKFKIRVWITCFDPYQYGPYAISSCNPGVDPPTNDDLNDDAIPDCPCPGPQGTMISSEMGLKLSAIRDIVTS